MKLLRSHLIEDTKLEDSIGGGGAEDPSKSINNAYGRARMYTNTKPIMLYAMGADDLSESMMHMNVRACTQAQNQTVYTRARQRCDLV